MVPQPLSNSENDREFDDAVVRAGLDPRTADSIREFIAIWRNLRDRRSDRIMPGWHDVDITAFAQWLGRIQLFEAIDAGRDFKFRVHGATLVDWVGEDLTGTLVSALDQRHTDGYLLERLRYAFDQAKPLFVREDLLIQRPFMTFSRIVVPFATLDDCKEVRPGRLMTVAFPHFS